MRIPSWRRAPRAVAVGIFVRLVRTVKRVTLRSTRTAVLVALPLLIAIPLGLAGYSAATWHNPQVDYYNRALAEFKSGLANQDQQALAQSVLDFQRSIAEGQRLNTQNRLSELLHGGAANSLEYESLAYLKEGIALLAVGSMNQDQQMIAQAVQEFENAIRVNPGVPYNEEISSGDIDRLAQEALPPKYDLELLFQQNPQQQQQQAQGKGKGKGQPKPGHNNAPGQNPQNVPGHGSPSGL